MLLSDITGMLQLKRVLPVLPDKELLTEIPLPLLALFVMLPNSVPPAQLPLIAKHA
jgi:hypothetical protein